MDELPHRAVIDLEATLSEFGHQPAHGKILPAPLYQPFAVRPRNLLWPIAADLVRLDAAGLLEALYPVDRVLMPTPNWAAARCRDRPPLMTALTTRSRRSSEYGRPIHAGLLPSQHVESEQT